MWTLDAKLIDEAIEGRLSERRRELSAELERLRKELNASVHSQDEHRESDFSNSPPAK
jgi:hypothetical protein